MKPRDVNTLVMLLKRGKISQAAFDAGLRFAEDFMDAGLHGLSAFDYTRALSTKEAEASSTESAALKSRATLRAIDALGGMASPCAKLMWDVVGIGSALNRWAVLHRFDHKEAKGMLIAGLNVLAKHYFFTS